MSYRKYPPDFDGLGWFLIALAIFGIIMAFRFI